MSIKTLIVNYKADRPGEWVRNIGKIYTKPLYNTCMPQMFSLYNVDQAHLLQTVTPCAKTPLGRQSAAPVLPQAVSRAQGSRTCSHCAVESLSGQMAARTPSSSTSAAVPGRLPRPASRSAPRKRARGHPSVAAPCITCAPHRDTGRHVAGVPRHACWPHPPALQETLRVTSPQAGILAHILRHFRCPEALPLEQNECPQKWCYKRERPSTSSGEKACTCTSGAPALAASSSRRYVSPA